MSRPGADPVGLAPRAAALAAVQAVEDEGRWSNIAVPRAIADLADPRDRALAAHLAYDTLRWDGTLRWALGHASRRPLDDIEPGLQRVLRLGALQLLFARTPAPAAVDTAAALARASVPRRRGDGAAGFVNGVLRGLHRQIDTLPWPDAEREPTRALALATGHPDWVVDDLLARFAPDRVRAILDADNDPPGVTLRATGDRDALLAELTGLGIQARPGDVEEAVRAPGADPRTLDAVRDGRAVPQDEASMRVARATGVQPGERVLDLCAGPGGKATHLAALAGESGAVTAIELHEHRARLIAEAAARQRVAVDVRVGDATSPPLADDDRYDAVLLDAPCTGLGTGRRRPEVRWRRTPADVASLAALQESLLAAAVDRVAPGGRLTYAVCTWTHGETEAVLAASAPVVQAAGLEPVAQLQLLPDVDDTDGMFIATFRRPS